MSLSRPAFAVVLYLSTPERQVESIDDLAGLGTSHPVSAAAMMIFLFSLIGLPLTAGFAGKFLLFVGTFSAPSDTPTMRHLYQILAVVAAVNAAVGAYYYPMTQQAPSGLTFAVKTSGEPESPLEAQIVNGQRVEIEVEGSRGVVRIL